MLTKRMKASLRAHGAKTLGDNWWDKPQYKDDYVQLAQDYSTAEKAEQAFDAKFKTKIPKFVVASPSSNVTYSSITRVEVDNTLSPKPTSTTLSESTVSSSPTPLDDEKKAPPLSWAAKAKAAPSKTALQDKPGLTSAELRQALAEKIKLHRIAIEALCIQKINNSSKRVLSAECTVCLVWTSKSTGYLDYKYALSGDDGGHGSLTFGKQTVCAEDNILRRGLKEIWFSIAYDKSNGFKPACKKGCAALLHGHAITDLYAAFCTG